MLFFLTNLNVQNHLSSGLTSSTNVSVEKTLLLQEYWLHESIISLSALESYWTTSARIVCDMDSSRFSNSCLSETTDFVSSLKVSIYSFYLFGIIPLTTRDFFRRVVSWRIKNAKKSAFILDMPGYSISFFVSALLVSFLHQKVKG